MLLPVSHGKYADRDRQTDGRQIRYITLSASRDQHNNTTYVTLEARLSVVDFNKN